MSANTESTIVNDPQLRKNAENIHALRDMFARAREEGLWFHIPNSDLWISPDELQEFQSRGEYCWGPSNWELRTPPESFQDVEKIRKSWLEDHGYRGGFTLIELLVVIVIISIVSVIALPTVVTSLRHREISEASRLIQGAIVGARDEAIHSNRPSGIRLLPDTSFSGIGPPTITTYDVNGNPIVTPNPYVGVLDPGQSLACNRIVPLVPAPSYTDGSVSVYPRFSYPSTITNSLPVLVLEQSLIANDTTPNSPTSWYWNIRVGDRIQVNNSGPSYVVVGPIVTPTPDGFVNLGNAGPTGGTAGPTMTVGTPPVVVYPEYLLLVNGSDDNGNGWTDEGFDGVDNNGNQVIDEPAEWEPEAWRGYLSQSNRLNLTYSVARRPMPGPNSRAISLPSNVVIDLTTWGTTLERSRVNAYLNQMTGYVDIMVNPDGTISPPSFYSSPSSFGMAASFIQLWVASRSDISVPSGSQAPTLPIGDVDLMAYASLNPPVAPKIYRGPKIQGDFSIITIFARTGKIGVFDNPAFDDPSDPIGKYLGIIPVVYDQGWPLRTAQQGGN